MTLTNAQRSRCDVVASQVSDELGLAEAVAPYASVAWTPEAATWAGPTLHLDDVSGVPFLNDIVGVQFYQLRARVRAGQGDLYVAACPGMDDYEAYCRDRLQLGAPGFVQATPSGPPIRVAEAARHGAAFDALVAAARAAGRMRVHPYMGIDDVWTLASDIRRAADVPVRVLAPPPPITTIANDKFHVTALANRLVSPALGTPATVETIVGRAAAPLQDALRDLATRHAQVALKMTRCASAMGNRRFDAADIQGMHDATLAELVTSFLADKEWVPGNEVLAVAWEHTDISPSTQMWIPPLDEGDPRLDGIYEQLLIGEEKVFLGSVPSTLSADIHAWMDTASTMMARVYQRLGYVGRCSFDFIVVDDQPLFVECNGRWGGTSTPMTLLDRLFPGGRPAYRARDVIADGWVGRPFSALVAHLGDALYDARTGRGRFILYNAGCFEPFGKIDVIALGDTPADATHALEMILPAALGNP